MRIYNAHSDMRIAPCSLGGSTRWISMRYSFLTFSELAVCSECRRLYDPTYLCHSGMCSLTAMRFRTVVYNRKNNE